MKVFIFFWMINQVCYSCRQPFPPPFVCNAIYTDSGFPVLAVGICNPGKINGEDVSFIYNCANSGYVLEKRWKGSNCSGIPYYSDEFEYSLLSDNFADCFDWVVDYYCDFTRVRRYASCNITPNTDYWDIAMVTDSCVTTNYLCCYTDDWLCKQHPLLRETQKCISTYTYCTTTSIERNCYIERNSDCDTNPNETSSVTLHGCDSAGNYHQVLDCNYSGAATTTDVFNYTNCNDTETTDIGITTTTTDAADLQFEGRPQSQNKNVTSNDKWKIVSIVFILLFIVAIGIMILCCTAWRGNQGYVKANIADDDAVGGQIIVATANNK